MKRETLLRCAAAGILAGLVACGSEPALAPQAEPAAHPATRPGSADHAEVAAPPASAAAPAPAPTATPTPMAARPILNVRPAARAMVVSDPQSLAACALRPSGKVYCWRTAFDGTRTAPAPLPNLDDAVHIALFDERGCAVRRTGAVACWGTNDRGQADGRQRSGPLAAPVDVPSVDGAVEVSLNKLISCALRERGDVICWGMPADDASPTPWAVAGFDGAVELQLGRFPRTTCVRTASREVVCLSQSARCWTARTSTPACAGPEASRVDRHPVADPVGLFAFGDTNVCAARARGNPLCRSSVPDFAPAEDERLVDAIGVEEAGVAYCIHRRSGKTECFTEPAPGLRESVTITGIDKAVMITGESGVGCLQRADAKVLCWIDTPGSLRGPTPRGHRRQPVVPRLLVGLP